MGKDDKEIVARVAAVLAEKIGSDSFDLWFSTRTSIAWNGARLQVFATDVFTLDRLRNKLRGSIESACRQVTGSADVDFRLVSGNASSVSTLPVPSKRNAVTPSRTADDTDAQKLVAPATRPLFGDVSDSIDVSPVSSAAQDPAVTGNHRPADDHPLFESTSEPFSLTKPSPTSRPTKRRRGASSSPKTVIVATSPAAKVSPSKVSSTKGSAAKGSAAKVSAAKVSAAKVSAAKVSAAKVSAAKVSAAKVSATKVSATNVSATKVSATKASASKVSATKVSAANVSATKVSASKVSVTKESTTKSPIAKSRTAKSPDIPIPAVSSSNTATAQRDVGTAATTPAARPNVSPASPPPMRLPAHWSHVVVGPCNQLALTAVQSVARQPGSVSPLYLYGPSGSGKSLLVDCLLQDSRRRFPGRRAVMLSAEQFTSQFVEALKGTGLPSFRRKYRDVDLLILDDVHFFAGKKATLIELQSTLDMLQRSGRQLVLTADRPPQDITGLGKELGNRLCGGLVCRLEPPDAETRLGILRHHCQQRGVKAPAAVLELIVDGVQGDARLLSGALWRLQAASQAWSRPITRELAEGTLVDLLRVSRRVIRLPDIEQAVCEAFGLDSRSLQSDGKQRAVSQPRMLAMWLARKYTRSALSEIGQYFGRRSHTSVIAANRKIDQWMDSDAPMPRSGRVDAAFLQAARRVDLLLRTGS